jgi:hypothetical protein
MSNFLLLGFDRVRWERRKAELRARLESERTRSDQTVIRPSAGSSSSANIMIAHEDDIRPARPILQKDIDKVNDWCQQLLGNLTPEIELKFRLEIGFKLRCWHDLIVANHWNPWCQANLKISSKEIPQLIEWWDWNEPIRNSIAHGRYTTRQVVNAMRNNAIIKIKA